jgi:hypothetical protein
LVTGVGLVHLDPLAQLQTLKIAHSTYGALARLCTANPHVFALLVRSQNTDRETLWHH